MFFASGESQSRLAKAAGAELAVSLRHENLHAAVARRMFSSQNEQNTPGSDHFLKFRCTPLWHEARFQVKMNKTHQARTTF